MSEMAPHDYVKGRIKFDREFRAGYVVCAARRGWKPRKISAVIETYAGAEAYAELAKKAGHLCVWVAFARDKARQAVLMGEMTVAEKRIYVVNDKQANGEVVTRLVNAGNPAQAIRHVAKGKITATPATVNQMAILAKTHTVEESGDA